MPTKIPIAIFVDEAHGVEDITSLFEMAIRCAPQDLAPRIYCAGKFDADSAERFADVSWALARFARQARLHDSRVVHITSRGVSGFAGRWVARRLGLPLTGSIHAPGPRVAARLEPINQVVDTYTRWLYDPCVVVFGAPTTASGRLSEARGRLQSLPRGVDADTFHPSRLSSLLRRRWHVDHRRPAIWCGVDLTRPELLQKVLAVERLLHRHGVAHQFVVADRSGDLRALAEKWPAAALLSSRATDEMAGGLASVDTALFLDQYDPIGAGVLEAQASGVPVVLAGAAGAHDMIRPGVTGLVCGSDPAEIAATLITMLTQPHLRSGMAQCARPFALGRRWDVAFEPVFNAWRAAAVAKPVREAPPRRRLAIS